MHLDDHLAATSENFDEKLYEKIFLSYSMLQKEEKAIERLQYHFIKFLNIKTVAFIKSSVSSQNPFEQPAQNITEGKNPFDDEEDGGDDVDGAEDQITSLQNTSLMLLYKKIPLNSLTLVYKQLLQIFWRILCNWYHVFRWHENNNVNNNQDTSLLKIKLVQCQTILWQNIQDKVQTLLNESNCHLLSFDEFLRILEITKRLLLIGETFHDGRSKTLTNLIQDLSAKYFNIFHRHICEQLKVFIENETWLNCPVSLDFNSFNFITNAHESHGLVVDDNINDSIKLMIPEATIFEVSICQVVESSTLTDDIFSNDPSSSNKSNVIICNSAIEIVRLLCKYFKMAIYFKQIVSEIMKCALILVDYYTYYVSVYFYDKKYEQLSGCNFIDVIDSLKNSCIANETNESMNIYKISKPMLNNISETRLNDPRDLMQLSSRLIAVESILSLYKRLEFSKSNIINTLNDESSTILLDNYLRKVPKLIKDIRSSIYSPVALCSFNREQLLQIMSIVKWELRDISTQHSGYVDVILKEFQIFNDKINNIKTKLPFDSSIYQKIWSRAVLCLSESLVEGFSNSKNCNQQGRALMLMDFQSISMGLEYLSNIKPLPYKEYVDNYIKAVYLSEAEFEKFIGERNEYSSKQISSLVSCYNSSKSTKQKLKNFFHEIDKNVPKIN